jgi:uncharacterized protein
MTSAPLEDVLSFECEGARLWGILSRPPMTVPTTRTAVLIVVGGPQYRVGSHRQFVSLARRLATAGYSTLRFDYTGMGDSEGEVRPFDRTRADLAAAIDALSSACPESPNVIVWGLCDAASAAMMFATGDARVSGIVAANPWVRSDKSLAATRIKHYYLRQLLRRDFWSKLLRGRLRWAASTRDFMKSVRAAHRPAEAPPGDDSFRTAMLRGLARFRGRTLLILSGNDLTAKEFIGLTESSRTWKGLVNSPRVSRIDLTDADHTFSRRCWLDQVEIKTIEWLHRLDAAASSAVCPQHMLREP